MITMNTKMDENLRILLFGNMYKRLGVVQQKLSNKPTTIQTTSFYIKSNQS